MTRRTTAALLVTLVTLGAAGTAAAILGREKEPEPTPDGPAATTTVRRQTLAEQIKIDGSLGYGDPAPMRSGATGTVTWLPKETATIRPGGTLLRVDNRPVVLLGGVLPLYRPLAPGTEGPDVRQFERNLRAFGYDGFTVDDEYTASTAQAVRRWQERLGLPRTGTVTTSWAVVAPGSIRIAELKVRIGDPGTGAVLTYTGTAAVVTVKAPAADAAWAAPGVKVSVALPGGKQASGKVKHVGARATGAEGEDPTVPVTIALTGRPDTGGPRESPVEVTYTGRQRNDVLTVPVPALLALADGGYGLQVVENGTSRYLAVQVGMFAEGRAEVSGSGLAEGMTVGMPA
ncbi:peptidoglycan hydrolase-like protein with peptidoglycan-binding domain [Actinoplanes campanulatus]|uniref:Peptidoglycan hydrolase-like protein with peptidoglycan-binding domain n=1 Tax=Actinoplanes campanulatus TaxID=113559 RepID=A0A7W5ADT4_9ACTN|nr:peptidoglycan-binding protein [Actinoplanes campanulatus]MBB3094338.1 peptidoglycan hydrolase-like protein with peptidoglycan-binding domain [Actinoplanes campanulatus]GGN20291.1 peptidoglycan-binding protein [Actinoplanes campanulatus]GID35744.1 peptidoglycan-binding protein [Actinoplanes campanulatus]